MSPARTTDAEWASFSASLARLLRKTPTDDTFAIELPCDDDSGAAPYVQFCAYGPGRIRCEVVSNEYLARSRRHSVEDLRWLAHEGWGEPGDVNGAGSPHHYLDVDVEWAELAADQAVRVLRDLWGVTDLHREVFMDADALRRFRWVATNSVDRTTSSSMPGRI